MTNGHAPTPKFRCLVCEDGSEYLERFEQAYRAELAVFVATVLGGGPSACGLDEARAALLAAVAADRSRNEHRPISIEEVASAEALTS